MDERTIKRLVIKLLVAISIIMLAKFMMTKSYTNLNNAVVVKKQTTVLPPPQPELATVIEMPVAVRSVAINAASSVENEAR